MRPPVPLPRTITLDGRAVTFATSTTATVWSWLAAADWATALHTLLHTPDQTWLATRLSDPDDPFDLPDLARLGQHVLAGVTGLPWWTATRLAQLSDEQRLGFTVWALTHHLNPDTLTAHHLAAAVVGYLYDTAEDISAVSRVLFTPPAGMPRWTPRQEAATFAAARAAIAAMPTARA